MAPSDQPATTVLGRPRPQPDAQHDVAVGTGAVPRAGVVTSISAGVPRPERSPPFEFRGFDFFANRDFNELKNASRAYFAPANGSEKHQRLPSTWLGDATPPSTPRQSDVRLDDGLDDELDQRFPVGGAIFPPPLGGQKPPSEKRILGLRRTQFWWLLALVAILLVVAIGVGVGVGVSKGVSHGSSSAAAAAAASSPVSTSTTPSSGMSTTTSTSTTSVPSSTGMLSSTPTPTGNTEGKIDCPAANGTTYQVPGSNKQFLRICGIDYSGDEAEDLRQVPTESILDCMKNCAGTSECTGCGWGYLEGDTGTQHTCFLKGNLKKSHEADVNWAFAVLL
ncbi:hypothetical protein F4677DRAFT_310236 [Hypoxylon crocopeplum]|nr:hypothetical protein F4677DRAFT_310236 [Hypoxylon crocopeplum]